ncbi:MAG: hypothetical protein NZM29_08615 [Nitrospira sp.]|nr:hypothetical protein [Nitrospira sp.]
MPDRVPQRGATAASVAPEPDFGVTDGDLAAGGSIRAELGAYRAAETLATVLALVGSALAIGSAVLVVVTVIVPMWRGDGAVLTPVQGLLWLIVAFIAATLSVAALFLLRACVLVLTDLARTLRAIERGMREARTR